MSAASPSPISAEELARRKRNREAFAEALRSGPDGVEGLKAVRQSLHYASMPLPETSDSTFVHPESETLRLTLEHMDKVNERPVPPQRLAETTPPMSIQELTNIWLEREADALKGSGPKKLGRHFVRPAPSPGFVSWLKRWLKR